AYGDDPVVVQGRGVDCSKQVAGVSVPRCGLKRAGGIEAGSLNVAESGLEQGAIIACLVVISQTLVLKAKLDGVFSAQPLGAGLQREVVIYVRERSVRVATPFRGSIGTGELDARKRKARFAMRQPFQSGLFQPLSVHSDIGDRDVHTGEAETELV